MSGKYLHHLMSILLLFPAVLLTGISCSKSDNLNQDQSTQFGQPQNVTATVNGYYIYVSWTPVTDATYYEVYVCTPNLSASGVFNMVRTVTTNSCAYSPAQSGSYRFKIVAVNAAGQKSPSSLEATCTYGSGTGQGGNQPGGDDQPGGEEPGGDDQPGDDTPGGTANPPAAPKILSADNYGSGLIPEIRVSWQEVSDATGYILYRSRSASGTYSEVARTNLTWASDLKPITGTNYYKVKAYNSAGQSAFSSYLSYNHDPQSSVAPCPVQYGSCTVSGTRMTLRWRVSTSSGCGKPDKAYLRVRNPISGVYADLQTLSPTATSASFTYTGWVDDNGYVYAGIVLENAKGTSGGIPKVYDVTNDRWF